MSKYFDREKTLERLLEAYREFGYIIVAYDFDDTVLDTENQNQNEDIVQLIKELRPYAKLILYTSRYIGPEKEIFSDVYDGAEYAINWLKKNDIPFDAVNENIVNTPVDGRKVYYDIFLDDKAGLKEAYETLKEFLKIIKKEFEVVWGDNTVSVFTGKIIMNDLVTTIPCYTICSQVITLVPKNREEYIQLAKINENVGKDIKSMKIYGAKNFSPIVIFHNDNYKRCFFSVEEDEETKTILFMQILVAENVSGEIIKR